tara:strand:- start:42 stop:701 length:660 start_codon:yes stop_codon:yes gene_type:complete
MSKILCELRICTNIENTNLFKSGALEKNNKRIQQYVDGIKTFLQFNKKYIDDKKIDVYVTDNTISLDNKLHQSLLDIIPENVNIVTCLNNNYGCLNKGSGDIEQWKYCSNLIKEYDYFIHFEPRQLLKSNQFIESFLENPRNLFTINTHTPVFNTGLFCIEVKYLLEYICNVDLNSMVSKRISIETDLYNFFINNNLKFYTLERMDLLWFANDKITYHW